MGPGSARTKSNLAILNNEKPKICVLYCTVSILYGGGDSVEAPMRRQRTVVPRPTQKLPSQKIGSSVFESRDLPTVQKDYTDKNNTG